MQKNQKGITLVALVITVIVLLILAGTAISIALNGDNLFERTNTAAGKWNNAVNTENTSINENVQIFYNTFDAYNRTNS